MRVIGVLLSVLLSFCVVSLNAITINVPTDQPTIQAGIDTAVDGDTVLVADGTYTGDGNRDIDFLGKAIVVMSENGAESCIIDCEGSDEDTHKGFHFHNGEDTTSVVQGFSIKKGWYGSGGGILIVRCSPKVVGNRISQCWGGTRGGGIGCWRSSAVIRDNIIEENTSGGGGGINCYYYSDPTITGNTITGNTAGFGGGICCEYQSSPIITGNFITDNTADEGGGINCHHNCSPVIIDNTISKNTAELGGGISCFVNSHPVIENTIIYENDTPARYEIWIGSRSIPSSITISYSDVYGGEYAIYVEDDCTLDWGDGMSDENPCFVLADKSDFRLLWGSPCIDAGQPDSLDADGTRSDIGAHSFNQLDYLTLYITPDMTEVQPGGELGVTYTAINRWGWSQPFWALSMVKLPGGKTGIVIEPDKYTLPSNYTTQIHMTHDIPVDAPLGTYDYLSGIGLPPGIVFDEDGFTFTVVE